MTDDVTANKLSMKPDYWRYFAGEAAKGGDCPLYETLSNAIAEDPAIQAVTKVAKLGQPPANMLFAAVHYILLGGAEHPIRLYYSHLLKPGEHQPPLDANAFSLFRDFVFEHLAEIESLVASRVTNTNEVRRCSYLRAGYAEIARLDGRPLHTIELGPSGGLNMNWDRYAYDYTKPGTAALHGGPNSSLTIDCEWRGQIAPPVPLTPPLVAHRIGLELNPVNLSRETDRRWLLSLLWPGQPDRIERMRKALAIVADHPPPIRFGDALKILPEELNDVEAAHAPVIVHSMVTYQWNEPMWQRLEDILLSASDGRVIYRLFQDTVDRASDPVSYHLRLRIYRDGAMSERFLANAHHHGAWIEWLG
jgi:hypothetical protein